MGRNTEPFDPLFDPRVEWIEIPCTRVTHAQGLHDFWYHVKCKGYFAQLTEHECEE